MPKILALVGYRRVLISNTVMLGLLIMLFATVGARTPVWLVVLQAFCSGFFHVAEYTSMNMRIPGHVNNDSGGM